MLSQPTTRTRRVRLYDNNTLLSRSLSPLSIYSLFPLVVCFFLGGGGVGSPMLAEGC